MLDRAEFATTGSINMREIVKHIVNCKGYIVVVYSSMRIIVWFFEYVG